MENTPIKVFAKNFLPKVANVGDAGIDLCYNGKKNFTIQQNTIYKIPTGLFVEIPIGKCGIIFERSGLGSKYGIELYGRIIDSGYRGEVIVILGRSAGMICDMTVLDVPNYPFYTQELIIESGTKVAQMIIVNCFPAFELVKSIDELSNTERGEKGLGSSGIK